MGAIVRTARRFVRDVPGLGPIVVGVPAAKRRSSKKRRRRRKGGKR